MFDFHLHSSVSFDSQVDARDIAMAAVKKGLREICFTDHYDYHSDPRMQGNLFSLKQYSETYESLSVPAIVIRKGVEFGLTRWNGPQLAALTAQYPFDFVLGSVHFVDGHDPYEPEYWKGKTVSDAFCRYLEEVYGCVKVHDGFDVLGHLTYVCKSTHNPNHESLRYRDYPDVTDEILKILVRKGKGLEVNTSGVDRAGVFLPSAEFLRRFKELGGEIVTVGSDAHDADRVGQYAPQALEMLKGDLRLCMHI